MAYDFGMVTGMGTACSSPTDRATREQAAAMMVRVLNGTARGLAPRLYAVSAYSQLGLTDAMDGVPVGWASWSWTEADSRASTTRRSTATTG